MADESSELQVFFTLQAENMEHPEDSLGEDRGTPLCYLDTALPRHRLSPSYREGVVFWCCQNHFNDLKMKEPNR